ncbi:aldo/keto reductase [Streptomyces prasinus]|uniref:aldo/keto reductase n=1 Tax=Streptomyces prasinus TaxID=67345 RepID=UPI00362CF634
MSISSSVITGLSIRHQAFRQHCAPAHARVGHALSSEVPALPTVSPRHRTGDAGHRRLRPQRRPSTLRLAAKVKEIAAEKDVTPAQLAIAWVLARGEHLVPIPGTKRRTCLEQNAAAVDIALTEGDLARIDADLPEAAGERYDEAGMRSVNR